MALFQRPAHVAPGDGGIKELIADGFRGAPDVDLKDYAAARGLEHRGQTTQLGMIGAMPLSEELQFNVLRGTLPGGEEREERPGRLGGGRRAVADPLLLLVGAQVLAPAAVVVLDRLQPPDGPAD